MARIPYEQIAPEANKLFQKMILSKDLETMSYWQSAYEELLSAAGWDRASFEAEEAKRVETGWEEGKPTIWN